MELKPNKLFFRRDGQIAGPFESHEGNKLQKSYHWLDINNGHWYNASGKVRYGKPEDRVDIEAEAPEAELTFTYCNWRGEIGVRRILPGRTVFKATEWHPEKQWLLEGFDLDKVEPRTFAMKDILRWGAKPPMLTLVRADMAELEQSFSAIAASGDTYEYTLGPLIPLMAENRICRHCGYYIPCKCGLNNAVVKGELK